jgi:hypothetical protein
LGSEIYAFVDESPKLVHDLNLADQMSVELVEFLRRNPQFEDGLAAGLLDRVAL